MSLPRPEVPPVAGLDNGKLKVFDDFAKDGKTTTLNADIEAVEKAKAAGSKNEEKLEANLTSLKTWWTDKGKPNFENDKEKLETARLFGAKQALLYTAAVPAALAVGFLLLLGYFALRGGYKASSYRRQALRSGIASLGGRTTPALISESHFICKCFFRHIPSLIERSASAS